MHGIMGAQAATGKGAADGQGAADGIAAEGTTLPAVQLIETRWDACESSEPGNWGIERDWRQDLFVETLEKMGIDLYGYLDDDASPMKAYERSGDLGDGLVEHYEIRTPLFVIRPFYWGDDDRVYRLPNFEWLPWHLEVDWYKYPFRDARSNLRMSDDDWREVCAEMLRWHSAMVDGRRYRMPAEEDRRSEADICAEVWAERLRSANDSADREWLALDGLLDALSVDDGDDPRAGWAGEGADEGEARAKGIQQALDQAAEAAGWGRLLDRTDMLLSVDGTPSIVRNGDGTATITLTIRTTVTRDEGDRDVWPREGQEGNGAHGEE